ncbi:MAG: PD-(D/E)XK nuclease family protein, partial [Syntrophomonadaceae bacterium]|nr:PD-(D/E)XK nuclease family protein [Syntrophomonadaceae bacterium]
SPLRKLCGDDPERLDARLLTASAQRARRERLMEAAVASRVGRVVFSFAGHDVVENRACFPSLLVLQVHRLLTGNPAADFSDLQRWLGAPAAFAPAAGRPALDAGEWWLAGGLECRPEELRPAVQALYPGLARADAAAAAQGAGQATAYDGMIEADPEALDPRRNPGLVLSPTMLETLAACPFAYFLRHVLGVRPPEGLAWDPERWLQANERGSLLHELYCRFMRRVTGRGERPETGRHRQEILEMAEELIARYRQEIPPPDEVAFASEARDIRRAAELFLEAQALLPAGEPLAFEVPFGADPDKVAAAGLGCVEPVEVPLGDGSLRLRGVIDRVDRLDDGAFAVWDYKTGSANRYEGEGYLQQGRLLQHALYALAAECVLRGNGQRGARVRTAGYLFPTERGEGRLIAREQSQREPLYRALECLLDILAQGAFIPGDDASRCGFCDYAGVCGGQEAAKRSRQLLEEAGDPRLEPWRRLMDVE